MQRFGIGSIFRDSKVYSATTNWGVEDVCLEDGTALSKMNDSEKNTFKSDSPFWYELGRCENDYLMLQGEDGLLHHFDDLTEEKQEEYEKRFLYYDVDIGDENKHKVHHHDAGNEGGGRTTWYRSACILFRPAANTSIVGIDLGRGPSPQWIEPTLN